MKSQHTTKTPKALEHEVTIWFIYAGQVKYHDLFSPPTIEVRAYDHIPV
jgi:hypothetical protein